jgi:hypothetical protein
LAKPGVKVAIGRGGIMHSFARVGSFIMTAVFVYAVALQCNDPDALR